MKDYSKYGTLEEEESITLQDLVKMVAELKKAFPLDTPIVIVNDDQEYEPFRISHIVHFHGETVLYTAFNKKDVEDEKPAEVDRVFIVLR